MDYSLHCQSCFYFHHLKLWWEWLLAQDVADCNRTTRVQHAKDLFEYKMLVGLRDKIYYAVADDAIASA